MVNYEYFARDFIEKVGTVSKKQLLDLITEYELLQPDTTKTADMHTLEKRLSSLKHKAYINKMPLSGDKDDEVLVSYGTQATYGSIPCLWAFLELFGNGETEINPLYLFGGEYPDHLKYLYKNVEYNFIFVDNQSLSLIPQSIQKKHRVLKSEKKSNSKTEFQYFNVYVTNRIGVADEIERFNIDDFPHAIMLYKESDSIYSQPEKWAFLKDGNPCERPSIN